jgi:hypothetical protein
MAVAAKTVQKFPQFLRGVMDRDFVPERKEKGNIFVAELEESPKIPVPPQGGFCVTTEW